MPTRGLGRSSWVSIALRSIILMLINESSNVGERGKCRIKKILRSNSQAGSTRALANRRGIVGVPWASDCCWLARP